MSKRKEPPPYSLTNPLDDPERYANSHEGDAAIAEQLDMLQVGERGEKTGQDLQLNSPSIPGEDGDLAGDEVYEIASVMSGSDEIASVTGGSDGLSDTATIGHGDGMSASISTIGDGFSDITSAGYDHPQSDIVSVDGQPDDKHYSDVMSQEKVPLAYGDNASLVLKGDNENKVRQGESERLPTFLPDTRPRSSVQSAALRERLMKSKRESMLQQVSAQGEKCCAAIQDQVERMNRSIREAEASQIADDSMSGFRFFPSSLGTLSVGMLYAWPPKVTHISLPTYPEVIPYCCYIEPSASPRIVELRSQRGLYIRESSGVRHQIGKVGKEHLGGASHVKKKLIYCTTGEGCSILRYRLQHPGEMAEYLGENPVDGAFELGGMDCSQLTGLLAVVDMRAGRITIEHPDGKQLHVVNQMEDGEQIMSDPKCIAWGPDGATTVIITEAGDDNVPPSVACIGLYPPTLKWRKPLNIRWNIWCENGLVFVAGNPYNYTRGANTNSMHVLSPHDGTQIGIISSCPAMPFGLGKDADGDIVIVSYTISSRKP